MLMIIIVPISERPDLPEDEGSALRLRDPTHRIFCVCHDALDLEMFDSLKTPSSIMSSKKKSVSPARSLPALTRTHCTWHTRPATRHGCSNTHNSSITVTSKTSSAPRLQGAPDPGGPRQAVGFNCLKEKKLRHRELQITLQDLGNTVLNAEGWAKE
ncbi:hypothetical protein CapIbe_010038 [Capra ibex]